MSNIENKDITQNVGSMLENAHETTYTEKPKTLVEELNESTDIMNKGRVEGKIREFNEAYKNRANYEGSIRLNQLSEEFETIYNCLSKDEQTLSKEALLEKKEKLEEEKRKNGATALNVAKIRNNEAKLDIIRYVDLIREIANVNVYDRQGLADEQAKKKKRIIIVASVLGAFGVALGGIYGYNKIKENIEAKASAATTDGYETTLGDDNTSTDSTTTTLGTTTSYSIETVGNGGYVSPTRATTTSNENGIGGTGSADATVVTVRPTTDPDTTSVISTPTNNTPVPTENTTTAVETDINGTQPGHTEPEVKPTGTDPLPVEPTRVTVDITSDPTTTTTAAPTTTTTATEATTTTTAAPTTTTTAAPTEPRNTTIEVPVVTVDPDDEANVKGKAKKFTLR